MTVTTPLGHVIRDEQGACLEFTRTFPTDVADLWSAITEPSRCARWFGNWTGDPSTGSVQVVMNAEDDNSAQPVTIVECTEAARLVVELPAPEGSWNLAMDLSEADGGSQLVFTQRLAESDDATSIGPGWHYYLDRLAAVVADTAVPSDWADYELLASQY